MEGVGIFNPQVAAELQLCWTPAAELETELPAPSTRDLTLEESAQEVAAEDQQREKSHQSRGTLLFRKDTPPGVPTLPLHTGDRLAEDLSPDFPKQRSLFRLTGSQRELG